MADTPREETIMKYPDFSQCADVSELHQIVSGCADELKIPLIPAPWPGQWAQQGNALRWESSDYADKEAESRILLANILLDGEHRYTQMKIKERDAQEEAVTKATAALRAYVYRSNQELAEWPQFVSDFDELCGLHLSIEYARQGDDKAERYTAMRTAQRLVFGLWIVTDWKGLPRMVTGSELKRATKAPNHLAAAQQHGARRI